MNSMALGAVITVTSVLLAALGSLLVRRLVPQPVLEDNHEVAAVILGVLGTLYAIVLGLVVMDSLSRHAAAEVQESIEANDLVTVASLSRGVPPAVSYTIAKDELDYAHCVLDREWTGMGRGEGHDLQAVKAFGRLWGDIAKFKPASAGEQNVQATMLSSLVELGNARRYRRIAARHGLPPLLWLVLLAGGTCTIASTYFFAARSVKLQVGMTAVLTLVFCLNLLLVMFYSSPYKGDTAVEPVHFRQSLDILEKRTILRHTEYDQEKNVPHCEGESD